jgi:polysaccharide deacetylase 2 family uncharacterized protein YibQ
MAADELNKPLGLESSKPRHRRVTILALATAAVVIVAGAVAWYALPGRFGPTATAVIDAPRDPSPDQTGSVTISEAEPADDADPVEIAPDDGVSDVIIYNSGDPTPLQLAALPEPALIEETSDGPLPRVGDGGLRPLDAYARPSDVDSRDPRIAIVVGGVGIDAEGTRNAISLLPGNVTLAFAPYGDDLATDLAAARASGHELLLQVPLEPFNYPRTDPGPNTLTAEAEVEENLARLHWFLGRLTNYVGVVNYMGARFTGEAKALKPVMTEIGNRGLLWLDDGSSPRSLAGDVAGSTPFLRSDMVLDADLSAASIDQRLRQLQMIARERGFAIATATAFPVTVERIAAFVRAAADRGIAVVPVSALLASPQ